MRTQAKIVSLLVAALSVGLSVGLPLGLSLGLLLGLSGCSNRNPSLTAEPNRSAALAGELPFNPLKDRVITSWIDRRNATMSTLYGNDVAVEYARTNDQHSYPAGSVLSVITWKQQEDPRWFGARIPSTAKSVEYVTVKSAPDRKLSYSYQAYEGSPLKKTDDRQSVAPSERTASILSQRAAVMP